MTELPKRLDEITLTVVLSPGISSSVTLELYDNVGMLERELALYNKLATYIDKVYLVTNGGSSERQYDHLLAKDVELVVNDIIPHGIPFSFSLPFAKPGIFRETDIIKTNQIKASWAAALASICHESNLLIRTGYVYSLFSKYKNQPKILQFAKKMIEYIGYGQADGVITSSVEGYEYIQEQYKLDVPHEVIPNYVETDVFRPMDKREVNDENSLCTVARFSEQKNLADLIKAIGPLSCSLTLVGSGKKERELRRTADQVDADVTFLGNVPNHELPRIFNNHQVYVLPSLYEGMPKSILEAMSCGMPVIGTRVPGTQEVVSHEVTGLLCESTPASLRSAIDRLLSDESLQNRLGENARQEIIENYSLDTVVEKELELINQIK